MIGIARARTFLSRLVRNQAGNTLAIAAAALIPLIALSGGAVDASRAYMAKTQLQAACDAGVLAGRRALGKTGQYGTSEKAKAQQMFSANFNGAQFGIANPTFTTSANSQNDVFGSSAIALPTVVMKIFNFRTLDMSVDCMAELQVANTDVMFVLDTTGSMGWSGIDGLRNAVKDFHATLASANIDSETRVRYGFVPYSLTVNAKGLVSEGQLSKSAFEKNVRYPTVVANFQNEETILTNESTTNTYTEDYSEGYLTSQECDNWARNYGQSPIINGSTGTYYKFDKWKRKYWSWSWYGTCQRQVKITQGTQKKIYRFSNLVYQDATVDASSMLDMDPVKYVNKDQITSDDWVESRGAHDMHQLADMANSGAASPMSTKSTTWDGCILERKTVVDYNFAPVPAQAYDHDIDKAPNPADDDTLWKPRWNDITWMSNKTQASGSTATACPPAMRAFEAADMRYTTVPSWLDKYLNELFPAGYTYHDIGMIWGARLGSPTGPFASIVNDRPNQAVSRHLIFMTDGSMDNKLDANSAYGIEKEEHRVAPSGVSESTLEAYHNKRFAAACNSAKEKGYTIWVIAFGTTITDQLKNCSTGGRAYFSSNTTELRQRFAYIASQVADLRLGQ